MAEKKNENTAAEPRFTKENLLSFEQYRNRRDLLYVLLEEERQYTTAEVDALIQKFMKGRVR